MKAANKGAKAPAELPEGRASTKGNSQDQSTYRTQGRGSVSQAVERIRQAATRKPQEKLTALLHHITTDALRCAFYDLKKTASADVDGLVWTRYEDGLEERLLDLHGRVHSGAYRALPSRRVEIPKPDGGTRPLGIAALEDKIVQKAVVDDILTPLYEPEFLGFSYGFRPGRGAHDALDALAFGIERRKVNWIIDADIRAFFDRLSRDHLLRFLGHRIGDQRVLRLIAKWLNAGVMEGDEWKDDLQGTPQGAVVSPILANVYLHYVLDLWFQKKWRARKATGDTIIVRYADDCAPRRRRREAEMAALQPCCQAARQGEAPKAVKSRGGVTETPRQVGCRETEPPDESVGTVSKPGRVVNPGRVQREPAAWLVGTRHKGGVTLHQALVRNVGTCRLDVKGEIQGADPQG